MSQQIIDKFVFTATAPAFLPLQQYTVSAFGATLLSQFAAEALAWHSRMANMLMWRRCP
jgi:hypothetical protein